MFVGAGLFAAADGLDGIGCVGACGFGIVGPVPVGVCVDAGCGLGLLMNEKPMRTARQRITARRVRYSWDISLFGSVTARTPGRAWREWLMSAKKLVPH